MPKKGQHFLDLLAVTLEKNFMLPIIVPPTPSLDHLEIHSQSVVLQCFDIQDH